MDATVKTMEGKERQQLSSGARRQIFVYLAILIVLLLIVHKARIQLVALIKALEEWKRKKQISDEEANLKIGFVKKYGAKEWEAVLRIKLDIENLERKDNEAFQHDLKEVRRVQFWCFVAALVVTLWLKFILGVI